MRRAEIAVVGLGAMGAAICHELARRGVDVVGLDRWAPPHDRGSTHGQTRIIREAYFEHPLYVPLVQRAYELWAELEELTGTVLYRRTGGLMIGPPDGTLVRGALRSAQEHRLPHELLDADGIRGRFPGLLPDPHQVGVLEHRAGAVLPEPAIRVLLMLARGYGAELRTGAPVMSWQSRQDGVCLQTAAGTILARRVVFAAGPWLNCLLAAEEGGTPRQLDLRVERQVSHWFAPAAGARVFGADSCPIAIWEYQHNRYCYTFPDLGRGVKIGIHHEGAEVEPDAVDREVGAPEDARARQLLDRFMPGAAERVLDAAVCLYTNTPDGHFVVDRHPHHSDVWLVSACSGHGFKFAPAVGEAVADELLGGGSGFDLTPFRLLPERGIVSV
jgi:sarcosine oxidase